MTTVPPICCAIITNYNGEKKGFLGPLMRSLDSCLRTSSRRGYETKVIVVDDCSSDKSLRILRNLERRSEKVKVLNVREICETEIDSTASTKLGLDLVYQEIPQCRYVATFDNDVVFDRNLLANMIEKAESSSKRVGMFAANEFILKDHRCTKIHRSTGHYVDPAGATWDRDFKDKPKTRRHRILCSCLSGSLLRLAMLKEIGWVPSEYLHYNNCSELGFRAQMNGWEVEFVNSAIMWHSYRPQKDITEPQKKSREKSRIWNIVRFFPREKIDEALSLYRKEDYTTSPTPVEREKIIDEALERVPQTGSDLPEEKKKVIYSTFIESVRTSASMS
jgi:GT2 family glycosyltransferase